MKEALYRHNFSLTAGECDATGHMPATLLTARIIETATEHANALGIGYAQLIKKNIGWVLSRLSFEMSRWPGINENYTLLTWIETYNRRFSERNFAVLDGEGNEIGLARTVWSAIDFAKRTGADLSEFERDSFPVYDRPCPMDKCPRIMPLGDDATAEEYTVRYCDLDFNRHFNTVRYVELLLNHWPLEHYDAHTLRRLDILFNRECHYGEQLTLRSQGDDIELMRRGERILASRLLWQ